MKTLKSILVVSTFFLLTAFAGHLNNLEGVKIGTQTWAKKNLDIATFKNGDPIKQIKSDTEWMMADVNKTPAWCYFEFDEENGKKYGKLYNGYALQDKRGLAPKGWRIPTDNDWKKLEAFVGKNANKLKADGPNETGFSALYSGSINVNGGFMPQHFMAWSSTNKGQSKGFLYRKLNDYNIQIYRSMGKLGSGFSIRCIK